MPYTKEGRLPIEVLPAVVNGLLTPEQVAYNLAWNQLLGRRDRVVYNAMGPDISTVLYLTNPRTIIGVDPNATFGTQTIDLVKKYWDDVDVKPILEKGSDMVSLALIRTPRLIPEELEKTFKLDLESRRRRGYWDKSAGARWGIERLLMLEMKKLGIKRETIKIEKRMIDNDIPITEIDFEWAFPGGKIEPRKLWYAQCKVDYLVRKGRDGFLEKIDCFYQKSLPQFALTVEYLKAIRPRLNRNAVVAVGHVFRDQGSNLEYKNEISRTLGDGFAWMQVAKVYEDLINGLPEEDSISGENSYGMKLHVFERFGSD